MEDCERQARFKTGFVAAAVAGFLFGGILLTVLLASRSSGKAVARSLSQSADHSQSAASRENGWKQQIERGKADQESKSLDGEDFSSMKGKFAVVSGVVKGVTFEGADGVAFLMTNGHSAKPVVVV
jgi:hypothetical protein